MLSDYAHIFGLLAVLLGLCNSFYALWLSLTGRTKPHAFTVLIWLIVSGITFFNFLEQDAGPAAWRTGVFTLVLLVNFFVCIRNGFAYINRFDIGLFIAAILTIPIWLVTNDPVSSLYWLIIVQLLGSVPMIRKAYVLPLELSATVYAVTSLGFVFQLLALETYNFSMVLYFIVFAFQFLILSIVLIVRRKVMIQKVAA